MNKRVEQALTIAVGLACLLAVVALGYFGWAVIVEVVTSPIAGLLGKVALTGKVLKIAAGVVLAIVAAIVGVMNHIRKPPADPAAPVPAKATRPPVFLPPDPDERQVSR